ncbi:hypothetical protein GRI89_09650 [Altererythrobacter salegens]|uniref:DUF8021 domain-containing protein n=1 Tax=Croceibacterium salegens TaxID=1737568 RepID=A0A6I4SVA6_9SPHN|nr:hypothetical protein [Croceibacterium salegens]MXO59803.1 hypothetical protein [Croceibacterium salegens]
MRTVLASLAALAALVPVTAMAQAAGETSAVVAPKCDRACLLGALKKHMDALRAGDISQVPLATGATVVENDVVIPAGTGLWRTVTGVDATGLEAADSLTGNAAWFGSVKENGVPAIYALRIHVTPAGLIDEVESVVHRKTALPAPFGDVTKMVHDPEFNEVLPPEQRRPRERMLSIADGYFSTVELNDGQVFTDFSEDCGRLENGISTTAPPPGGAGGNAAAIASGCRAQFLLGLYKINKRIRRDFFIIDEERGVAVGRGFFDHANEFDRYKLTDGREMKTALKWPNSISLIEAFRIRDGNISRIEAVFTYVPYFMNNPFWGPDSAPPAYAAKPDECGTACLDKLARGAIGAMKDNQWRSVNWADRVGYAENSVGIRVGEGIWSTVTATDSKPLVIADEKTGKAVWIGQIEEHGQPSWGVFTVTSDGNKVGGIDALIRRKEYGAPYGEPSDAATPQVAVLPAGRRTSREAMRVGAMAMLDAGASNAAKAPDVVATDCAATVNGQPAGACGAVFGSGAFDGLERVRDIQVLAVDEARGLIAIRTFEDRPALGSGYPRTFEILELMRFDADKVVELRSFLSELPYGMPPHG